jgi:hypothetical protein
MHRPDLLGQPLQDLRVEAEAALPGEASPESLSSALGYFSTIRLRRP